MRFSFTVHQKDAIDAGIPNGNCLLVFEIVASANQWAQEHQDGYWWTARQAICAELELWKLKPDTVYRHLKKLQEIGLIDHKKHGKKDLTKLTKKGKKFFGNPPESTMSEIDPDSDGEDAEIVDEIYDEATMSDLDPNHYVGNRSENAMSEIDPNSENPDSDPSKSGNRSESKLGNRSDISLTTKYISRATIDQEGGECARGKNELENFGDHFLNARAPKNQPPDGLKKFQQNVNFNGRFKHCGMPKLIAAWNSVDGEENADLIIANFQAHIAAGTWSDEKPAINTLIENRAWAHPPTGASTKPKQSHWDLVNRNQDAIEGEVIKND